MYIERPDWTTKNISIGNYSIYHRLECVEHSKFTYDTIYCILNYGPWNRTQRIIINDLYWRNFVIIRKKLAAWRLIHMWILIYLFFTVKHRFGEFYWLPVNTWWLLFFCFFRINFYGEFFNNIEDFQLDRSLQWAIS